MTPTLDLTLTELGRCCAVDTLFVIELLDEGAIMPLSGHNAETWLFPEAVTGPIKLAWRLHRDLGVNLAGAALALQLLDEIETLRSFRLPQPSQAGGQDDWLI